MANHGHSDHQFRIMPTQDHSAELGHIVPYRVYVSVLVALLILTVITVWVSRIDFGTYNVVIALSVASVKALLVAMYFMHLKFENKFTLGYAVFPFILLAILIGAIFLDNPFRSKGVGPSVIDAYSGGRFDPSASTDSAHNHH